MRSRVNQRLEEKARKTLSDAAQKIFLMATLVAGGLLILSVVLIKNIVVSTIFLLLTSIFVMLWDNIPCFINKEVEIGRVVLKDFKAYLFTVTKDVLIVGASIVFYILIIKN